MMNRDDLIPDIVSALSSAPYHLRARGSYLEQGICPSCGQKSFWTWAEKPWNMQCNKKNNCGYTVSAKDLLPDVFTKLSKRYIPTDDNPNATADAYLKFIRGFDINLVRGQYSQSTVFNSKNGASAPGVRFYLDAERTRYFERVIENEKLIGKKAHFGGKRKEDGSLFKGDVWQPQTLNIRDGDTIYITEGIFDAIALNTAGFKAVSALSAGAFPDAFIAQHGSKAITWAYALDNDAAGINASKKHLRKLSELGEDAFCVLPEVGSDWNELLNVGKLTEARMKDYRFFGDCATATSAEDKAAFIYSHRGRSFFTFDYANRLYGFDLDTSELTDAVLQFEAEYRDDHKMTENDPIPEAVKNEIRNSALTKSGAVTEIANCVPKFLYTQRNPAADELAYFYRVSMPNGRIYKDTLSNAQQQNPSKFTERLGAFASGADFHGNAAFYKHLRKSWMADVKEIRAVDFAGYDDVSGGYVFNDFAVFDGVIHKINDEEYIDTGKVQIKSDYHNVNIRCNLDADMYSDEWFHLVQKAWGMNGLLATAYFTGAVFANQIRSKLQNFPFLELVGDPGTGKSALLKGLWAAFGRQGFEGFNPGGNKATAKFLPRVLAQTTLPTVFIEGDSGADGERKAKSMQWDDFKDLYGGSGLYGRAKMSNDNQVHISDFRGSLVIAQNFPVKDAQPAFLERIVQCWFDSKQKSESTRRAAEALYQLEADSMSGFLIKVIQHEKQFLEVFFKYQKETELKLLADPNINIQRVAFTHSVLMGLIKAAQVVLPIKKDDADAALLHILTMARDRQVFINREDPRVESYFDAIEFMEGMRHNAISLNHSKNPAILAIDLNQVESEARRHGLTILTPMEIKPLLERSQAFLKKNHAVSSAITSKVKKCWTFKARPKLSEDDLDLDLEEGAV